MLGMDVNAPEARVHPRTDGPPLAMPAGATGYSAWMFPLRLIAAGPGRSATPSTTELPVAGRQNTDPSTAGCGRPSLRSPGGEPRSTMRCVPGCPKAPALFWPGQNKPDGPVTDAVPVVCVVSTDTAAW